MVSDADNHFLIQPSTLDEIHTALFSMDFNKTSGPDGFGASFFKTSWHTLKSHLFDSIAEFFRMVNS